MAVSLTLLTLHVVLFLLTDAIKHRSNDTHRPHMSVRFNPPRRSPDVKRFHQQQRRGFVTRGRDQAVRHFVTDRRHAGEWRDAARREELTLRWSKHAGRIQSDDVKQEDTSSLCGDGWCSCNQDYADCSGHYGALKYIPKLPARIDTVDFSFNELKSIDSDLFLSNVTNISALFLSYNKLTVIAPGAFQHMSKLNQLYLANIERLTYDVLGTLTAVKTLQGLDVSGNNLGDPPVDVFVKFPMLQLTDLDLSNTGMKLFNCSVFAHLKNLRTLYLRDNFGMSVIYDYLPSLVVLDLGSISTANFPTFCTDIKAPFFPNLSDLSLNGNFISALPPQFCLSSLTSLDLSMNPFVQITTDMFNQSRFPRLSSLTLNSITLQSISSNAFRSPSLSNLMLGGNNLDFGSDAVSADAFAGCPGLSNLDLLDNDFSRVSDDKFQRLFGHLRNLQSVYFDNNSLSDVAKLKIFIPSSFGSLGLVQNKVDSIPDGAFDNLTSISQLFLFNNQISMVTESTFSPATRQRLTFLDLSGNPFYCSDDLTWFCQWMKSDPELFSYPSLEYMCHNRPGVKVTSLCPDKAAVDLGGQVHELTTSEQRSSVHVLDPLSDQRSSAHGLGPSNDQSLSSNVLDSSARDVYKVLVAGTSLLILLVVLAVVAIVCWTRHFLLRRGTCRDTQRLLKGSTWQLLAEDSTLTSTHEDGKCTCN